MRSVLAVVGTRPEAIKMAPLLKALASDVSKFRLKVCGTAQHREMLDQVLSFFEIRLDYDLDVMEKNQSLGTVTAKILENFEEVLSDSSPDIVLVHGDTSTTLSASLGSFYAGVPVGHVEAGLRSGDILSPFPEEFNRRAVSLIASKHFAPTELNRLNLIGEGVESSSIFVTGNTGVDAALEVARKLDSDEGLATEVETSLFKMLGYAPPPDGFVLITVHRRENLGERLRGICQAIGDLSMEFPDVRFILPIHPNPSVKSTVKQYLGGLPNVSLIQHVSYPSLIFLLRKSMLVLTDSGGIQEEAPSFGTPVVVLRNVTERAEGLSEGFATMVGSDASLIRKSVSKMITVARSRGRMMVAENPYGDGRSSERIVEILKGL